MTEECAGGAADHDRVADLQRWQDSGAVWRVVSRTGRAVTIGLLRCDGGEEVDRFTTDDPRAGIRRRPAEQRLTTLTNRISQAVGLP